GGGAEGRRGRNCPTSCLSLPVRPSALSPQPLSPSYYGFLSLPISLHTAFPGPGIVLPNSLSSARRFTARPSSVELGATGTHSPKLRCTMVLRSAGPPCRARYFFSDSARRVASRSLYLTVPSASACPSMVSLMSGCSLRTLAMSLSRPWSSVR